MDITSGFGKKLLSRAAVLTAGAALAVGGFTTSAYAYKSANISSWTVSYNSCPSYFMVCLFYSPGGTGGRYGSKSTSEEDLSGFTFGGSGAGVGDRVINDAASADNNSGCNVGIWDQTWELGDSDWLNPHTGGNLGPALRNNEASFAEYDSYHGGCPH